MCPSVTSRRDTLELPFWTLKIFLINKIRIFVSTAVIINPKSEMTFLSLLAHQMQQRKRFPAVLRLSFCDNYSIQSCIFSDGTVGICEIIAI